MKLSGQHINGAWLYIVTKMVLLTKIGENKEVNMDVQITGNSLIIKILDYREIIEPDYFENLKEELQRFKSEYENLLIRETSIGNEHRYLITLIP
jgi:hypothetical protein|nr:MAG TPA: hypothetical protein [Caudoviricetes sp.]